MPQLRIVRIDRIVPIRWRWRFGTVEVLLQLFLALPVLIVTVRFGQRCIVSIAHFEWFHLFDHFIRSFSSSHPTDRMVLLLLLVGRGCVLVSRDLGRSTLANPSISSTSRLDPGLDRSTLAVFFVRDV
uniref:Uncharacterized protein n=1 Tax=Anopheles farauti TaxID=69004 RepID=A0A182QWJ7_9DIPT